MAIDKDIIINYSIEKSWEAARDAKLAIENNSFFNAENRIYYAIFYLVSALALKNEFSTSKHRQLMGWFNQNYIKTQKIRTSYKIYTGMLMITVRKAIMPI